MYAHMRFVKACSPRKDNPFHDTKSKEKTASIL